MNNVTITVRLFGAFRKYGETLSFSIPAGSAVPEIRKKLSGLMDDADKKLIADSVFANDDVIITDDEVMLSDAHLAILPPVCGG